MLLYAYSFLFLLNFNLLFSTGKTLIYISKKLYSLGIWFFY